MSRRRRTTARVRGPEEPLDRARALASFSNLEGRCVVFGFVAVGPVLPVRNPDQLAEDFADWLRGEVGQQRPS